MTKIASVWLKMTENGEPYFSITPDKNLVPITITEDTRLSLKEVKNKSDNPNAPTHYLDMWKVDKNKHDNDEIPM